MTQETHVTIPAGAETLIWDFDGTLINSYGMYCSNLTAVLERRNMALPSEDVLQRNYHGTLTEAIQGALGVTLSEAEELRLDFLEQEDEHSFNQPDSLYYQDAIDLTQRAGLAGLRQIIVTNREHVHDGHGGSPRTLARRAPLGGLIEAVYCGDDTAFRKPDVRVLAEAAMVHPERSFVIGDQHVDAQLAINLGAGAILVSRPGSPPAQYEQLPAGWQACVHVVPDLGRVRLASEDTK